MRQALGVLLAAAIGVTMVTPIAAAAGTSPAKPAASSRPAPAADTSFAARLAGTWQLDIAASELGKSPRVPRWRQDRIVRDRDRITVRMVSVRASGDTLRLEYAYNMAGDAVNRMAGQEVRTRGRREAGGLALESEAQMAMIKIEVSERWNLSADGATLTQVRASRSPMGEEKQRMVFRRAR